MRWLWLLTTGRTMRNEREGTDAAPRPGVAETPVTRVTLRYAVAADQPVLRTLADVDSAFPPGGSALVAEVDGRLRAALPLDGGQPIADPSHNGGEMIALLRLRALQLRGAGAARATG